MVGVRETHVLEPGIAEPPEIEGGNPVRPHPEQSVGALAVERLDLAAHPERVEEGLVAGSRQPILLARFVQFGPRIARGLVETNEIGTGGLAEGGRGGELGGRAPSHAGDQAVLAEVLTAEEDRILQSMRPVEIAVECGGEEVEIDSQIVQQTVYRPAEGGR